MDFVVPSYGFVINYVSLYGLLSLLCLFCYFRHTEFTKLVREKMEESGGMEDCVKSGKKAKLGLKFVVQ